MIEQLPTLRSLLKHQHEIHPDLRQHCVLLRFSKPVSYGLFGNFHRIHLTQRLLDRGENDHGQESFWEAEISQSHRVRDNLCPRCRRPGQRISFLHVVCHTPRCENRGRTIHTGPVRGVVQVKTFPDWVVGHEDISIGEGMTIKGELVDRALLILDRRYPDDALASVYRTAGMLAETLGWSLL